MVKQAYLTLTKLLSFGLIVTLTVCIGIWIDTRSTGHIMNEEINWTSLSFTCVEEQNPPVDSDADKWFKEARAIQKGERPGSNAYMLDLYEKAAEKKHYKALNNLANIYGYGSAGKRDEHRAIDLIEQGMALEVPACYYTMGHFLDQGIGVKQDKIAALPYLRKAADMGNRYGQYVIGEKLLSNFRLSPDKDKILPVGIKMLECSLGQGYSKAGIELGYYFSSRDHHKERGLIYLQKAGALGDTNALFSLHIAFKDGTKGATRNSQLAECYLRLSEEVDKDKTKTFPDIDTLCPLPPRPTE